MTQGVNGIQVPTGGHFCRADGMAAGRAGRLLPVALPLNLRDGNGLRASRTLRERPARSLLVRSPAQTNSMDRSVGKGEENMRSVKKLLSGLCLALTVSVSMP